MAKTKLYRGKYKIEATNPPYRKLEMALFTAKDTIGWKSLTALLVQWTRKNQPTDTNYSIDYWIKEIKKR